MKNDVNHFSKRKAYMPYVAIAFNWLVIGTCIYASERAHSVFVTAIAIVIVGCRQHGLFLLTHEGVHIHMASNKRWNDILSNIFCAWPILFDTESYRRNHLKHHRHLNTDQDPDWVRKHGHREWIFPVKKMQVARFIPFFIFYRGPTEWAQIVWVFSGLGDKLRWKSDGIYLVSKLLFWSLSIALLLHFHLAEKALLYWALPLFMVFPLIQRFRSIADHFGLSYEDVYHSTRDVVTGPLERFLFAPHHINYHLTHHQYPQIPCYNLPKAHEFLRNSGEFENAHINSSYLWPYSGSVIQDLIQGPRKSIQPTAVGVIAPKTAKSA